MKILLATFCAILLVQPCRAQNWDEIATEVAPGWYRIQTDEKIEPYTLLEKYGQELGLGGENTLILKQTVKDKLGFTHYRFQQHYAGVPVEGAQVLLHSKNGRVVALNGDWICGLQADVKATLSPAEAMAQAKEIAGARIYAWEMKKTPAFKPEQFKPTPKLVLMNPQFSKDSSAYLLAYKIDLFAIEPYSRYYYFINALTGDLLQKLDRIHTSPDTGFAVTKYHGLRSIIADSVPNGVFILRDSLTGGGVYTFNMQQSRQYSNAVDFVDSNNYWNNFNAQQDEVATDVHWGTEVTYRYFFSNFGRRSFDDNNSALLSYVHFDRNYVNAFWNGSFMTYGDGNGSTYLPLTALDVVGHEIAHGVTQFSAGLIYRGESGALNESFSDIFGTSIEFTYDTPDADWTIGEKFTTNQQGFRSMSNPKQNGDPDTYTGQFWGYGVFIDNGFVHSNSGVQNFWYHLLVEGGSGINDLGAQYSVQPIGLQKAQAIAYRNLNVYLTPLSNHFDARQGSLFAAEDLYGTCANELIQCANAWYAVGVGQPINENDIVLIATNLPPVSCKLSASEPVKLTVFNNSCSFTIPAGDTLQFQYILNSTDTATENLVLSQALQPGDTISYTFQNKTDLLQFGNYNFDLSVFYPADSFTSNNFVANYEVLNRPQQNSDFALLAVSDPISGCNFGDSTSISLTALFNGCDSTVAGQVLRLTYAVNGKNFRFVDYTLPHTYYFGDTFNITLPVTLDISQRGLYQLDIALSNSNDANPANDSILGYSFSRPFDILNRRLSFESQAFEDSLLIETGPLSIIRQWIRSTHGNRGLLYTGGNTLDYPGGVDFPLRNTVWSVNKEFNAKACACIDARAENNLSLAFDLKQEYSEIYHQVLNNDYPYASPFRIKINGQQVSPTYIPATYNQDIFQTYQLDLSPYAGQQFELCFEARPLTSRTFNTISRDGDEAFLDNIRVQSGFIGENELQNSEVKIYPNPNGGSFVVNLAGFTNEELSLHLTDLSGKVLPCFKQETREEIRVTSNLPAGVYLLKIKSQSGFTAVKKVLIQ